MKKKITAFLLSISISVSMFAGNTCVNSVVAHSIENDAAATASEGAEEVSTGTQENVRDNTVDVDVDIKKEVESTIPDYIEEIKISSAKDLVAFSKKCRLDTWSRNKYVVLTEDISLINSDFVTIPTFGGIFDGNGHTISEFNVYDEQSNIGVFAKIQSCGVVKNLNVQGRVMPSGNQSNVGGIAGINDGVIYKCTFKGVVSSTDYVGGIAGLNSINGIIADTSMSGYVFGQHFTGGIVGENIGNVYRCVNHGEINTTEQDVSFSIEDFNIESYLQLFSLNSDNKEADSASKVNGVVDTGGIAGLSIGVIQHCTNEGTIGYEKIGYNVGGIAGRQSGYLYDCTNTGHILGRKDVGGITGQAEPYVTVDFTQDIIAQLSDNINKLHDIIAVTLNDVDGQSDTISNRLSIIQQFTNGAIEDTNYLSENTVDWLDGMTSSGNELISRADYVVNELSREGGALDQAKSATDSLKGMGNHLVESVNDLDLYKYLSDEDQLKLQEYTGGMSEETKRYTELCEKTEKAFKNYQLDRLRSDKSSDYYKGKGYDLDDGSGGTVTVDEKDLRPVINGNVVADWEYKLGLSDSEIYEKYKDIEKWVHYDTASSLIKYDFPADINSSDNNIKAQGMLDSELREDMAKNADAIATASESYANVLYKNQYGTSYRDDMKSNAKQTADIITRAADSMGEEERENARAAADELERAANGFKAAVDSVKGISQNLSEREDIVLPSLGAEYKAHTSSLTSNLQGMNDNFGYLNAEMNGATDVLVADLSGVNDQFNVIMNLFTDAIDGVLDQDYSPNIEDDSLKVARTCTDATIANCQNKGSVEGSIDVSGIAGTMGIEYDYDLESDVTGIKDSATNTTYLTKCVLRENKNTGIIQGEKSYVSGVCGLQEMGTIIGCENYSKITSSSGDYVGGIAGCSLSDIVESYVKCALSGENYVGGVAGKCNNVSDCYTLVNIKDQEGFTGAIAGDVTSEGIVRNNYFTSDELAGIDRISYSRKAEPIEYEKLLLVEGIPSEFSKINIDFLLDDEDNEEDRTVIYSMSVDYNDIISVEDFPEIPKKVGYYADWDVKDNFNALADEEITATYLRNVTTLASDILRSTKQSAILVDGIFSEEDELVANLNIVSPDLRADVLEYWELVIPEDGQGTHQIRYSVDDEHRDQIGDDFGVYVYSDNEWVRVNNVGRMGAYYTFEVPGNRVKLQFVNEYKGINKALILYIVIGVVIFVAIVLLMIIIRSSSKKRSAGKKKKVSKSVKSDNNN